jgi:hypothetical protein
MKLLIFCVAVTSCLFTFNVQAQAFNLSSVGITQHLNQPAYADNMVLVKDNKNYNKQKNKKNYHKRHNNYRYDNRRHHSRHDDRNNDALLWGLGAAVMTGLLLESNQNTSLYRESPIRRAPQYYICYVRINGALYQGSFQSGGPCYVQYGNQLIAVDRYTTYR